MSDLIDRDATIKAICEKECDALKPCQAECESIWAVMEMPSAQPKGKWLKAGTRMGVPLFECSLCECAEEVPTVMGKPSYNFCPNCGCRMGEGESQ